MADEHPSNQLTLLANMQISTRARQVLKHVDDELAPGLAAPFAVVGYKGARWSLRYRGKNKLLERLDAQGRHDGYEPFLDLVLLRAANHNSKVYYAKAWGGDEDEGTFPDCWSTDGQRPDAAVKKKVSPQCHDCPMNQFGSRINQATQAKGKACADTRRIAVVPWGDIENAIAGGPMLLRVPPASLGNFGEYSDKLKVNSVPYPAIVTRVSFDGKESYPKMVFAPLIPLTDAEVDRVAAMQNHPLIDRMIQQQLENIVDQTGSEQGAVTAKPGTNGASVPPSANQVTSGDQSQKVNNNSPSPPVGTPQRHHNPFARAIAETAGGPSYPGNQAVQRQQEIPPDAPTHFPHAHPEPAAAPQQEVLTPDQLRMKEMELEIARLRAGQTSQPRKRRTQPVAPATVAEPADAQPTSAGEPIVPDTEGSDEDPALAAITNRLEEVLQR